MRTHALNYLTGALLLTLVVLPGDSRERIAAGRSAVGNQQRSRPAKRSHPHGGFSECQKVEQNQSVIDIENAVVDIENLEANLEETVSAVEDVCPVLLAQDTQELTSDNVYSFSVSEDHGWLGVSVAEVTPEKVKELKLPAERGVLISNVEADSPAAKAGLKSGDVITELAGLRIEGAAQFRRLVHETPPGRTVAFTIWRDGRAQTISAALTSRHVNSHSGGHFAWPDGEMHMVMPAMPDMPSMPIMPSFPSMGEIFAPGTPRLGIDAQDLSGELGKYFGAPEGEGVLIREVRSGSAAEKAGLKAGDVIIKLSGERVGNSSDLRTGLRTGLRGKRESKTVDVVILRKGTQMTLPVTIEPVVPPADPRTARRVAV
ncbi:MAG: PDZ domain-containing protein [Acidipila sp.]|nr:PDZ domain-containing protein [Acidipila sp.]